MRLLARWMILVLMVACAAHVPAPDSEMSLIDRVVDGDRSGFERFLNSGAEVNAKDVYGERATVRALHAWSTVCSES